MPIFYEILQEILNFDVIKILQIVIRYQRVPNDKKLNIQHVLEQNWFK